MYQQKELEARVRELENTVQLLRFNFRYQMGWMAEFLLDNERLFTLGRKNREKLQVILSNAPTEEEIQQILDKVATLDAAARACCRP